MSRHVEHGQRAAAPHLHVSVDVPRRAAPTPARLGVAQRVALAPLRFYRRFLSPLKPVPSCRFHPTCSSYAVEAVQVHGALRGLWMALMRLLRCHPFHPGGFDPVPPRTTAAPRTAARHDAAPQVGGVATEEP